MERTLTHEQARRFYDRFGARQDGQAAYEDPPNHELAAQLELARARDLLELGCGTGRFAEHLLTHGLPEQARYSALDLSETMVQLSRARLARFGARVSVALSDGSMKLPAAEASVDRFVSTYVFDLLSREDIAELVAEIRRVLRPGGLAGITGLAHGSGALGRTVTWLWQAVHRLSPERVGGCRPLELRPLFAASDWDTVLESRHSWHGLTSLALIVRKR